MHSDMKASSVSGQSFENDLRDGVLGCVRKRKVSDGRAALFEDFTGATMK